MNPSYVPLGHYSRRRQHQLLGLGCALLLATFGLIFLGPVYAPEVMNLVYPQARPLEYGKEPDLPHVWPPNASPELREWMGTVRDEVQRVLGSKKLVEKADCSLYPKAFKLTERYAPLSRGTTRYLIAANFRNSEEVLPTTIEQLLQLALFLGPRSVDVSIYENDSSDKTRELLKVFEKALQKMGSRPLFNLTNQASDYKGRNRIDVLSDLRNLALGPLYEKSSDYAHVLFINDGSIFSN